MTKETTTPPDFTEHSPLPWKWLPDEGQFIVDAKGNIVAEVPCQGCNPADGEFIVRRVNQVITSDLTEQARQLALRWQLDHELYGIEEKQTNDLADRVASFAAEAATQGQVVGIERAAKVECNFCKQGNVPIFVDFEFRHKLEGETPWTVCRAGRIRALSPDPCYLDRVCNEAATAALKTIAVCSNCKLCEVHK